MKFSNVEIWGKKVEVDVNDGGRFTARHADEYFSADTFDGIVAQLKRAIQKTRVRISVEFTNAKGQHCIVTGKHATTGKLLVKVAGTTEQMNSVPYDAMHKLTSEELAEYERLVNAASAANRAVNDFTAKHRYTGLTGVVRAAFEAASVAEPAKAEKKEVSS